MASSQSMMVEASGTSRVTRVIELNKSLNERVVRIERLRGKAKFVFATRDPVEYTGVKVNGCLMSEKMFERFTLSLPSTTELYVISIVDNEPAGPCNE